MEKIKFTILCMIIYGCAVPEYGFAYSDTLVLAIVSPSHARVYKISEAVLGEALKRNGYKLILNIYPPRRAELLAESGEIDGDAHRIFLFGRNHPSLVRVPEPVQSTRQSVFTRKLNFKPELFINR